MIGWKPREKQKYFVNKVVISIIYISNPIAQATHIHSGGITKVSSVLQVHLHYTHNISYR